MDANKIYDMLVSKVYPLYVNKVTKKGQSEKDLMDIISWLTGYSLEEITNNTIQTMTFRDFFEKAPKLNPNRYLIKGSICGVKVQEIKDPLMQNIRYLDKIVDELSKGKSIEKIKRQPKV